MLKSWEVRLKWLTSACGRQRGHVEVRDYSSDFDAIDGWVGAGLCEITARGSDEPQMAIEPQTADIDAPPIDRAVKRPPQRRALSHKSMPEATEDD